MSDKKNIVWFLIFLFPLLIAGKQSWPLKISLIPFNNSTAALELKKGDIKLFINDVERDILEIKKEIRSLSRKSHLGRNFILSINLIDYGQHIVEGITCFINEVLFPGDILLLISPKGVYQIDVIKKKEQVLKIIMKLIKKDCYIYKNNRSASKKNLDKILKRLENVIENRTATREGDLYSMYNLNKKTAVHQFLSNYSREFLSFKNQFLLPDTGKFQRALDILGTREGEKWWIHFQQRDIYPSLSRLRQMIGKIRSYLSSMVRGVDMSWASSIATRVSQLEKQLFLADQYPTKGHLGLIRKGNIHYHVLFFQNLRKSEKETVTGFAPDLEDILQKMADWSGGKAIISNDLKNGIREIKNHWVYFFNLFWNFNGVLENKKLKLVMENPNLDLGFRENFSKQDIEHLYHFISKKVRIKNLTVNSDQLEFSIVNFNMDKNKHYGILKVEINLFNTEQTSVFKSENSLRGYKKNIDISLPFPEIKPGLYILKIKVYDLLANTQSAITRKIQLD